MMMPRRIGDPLDLCLAASLAINAQRDAVAEWQP